ncbi:Lipopolysaccharide export LptBFGC system, permease protein LptF [Meinhardsimonia xiamenensis]|jgi:lipopolysaccharide export system permease protein|uniref:Lipopolysaccharide export LptBFGC system, permease protein LptF n=1 Tax=Meinhardsimonia xiamenensis TaxID=990712 RepID=A0A1G9FGI7_9RHOB|nr:LptF/LptG family permease [Meinhardsimonia xiamenensis]PRX37854.1 lipopolysaccharide export LptBFGC system permease protein LptF [Meinhardsimonia xiamenensis]SDK87551.1 Lipopolysaccharide export LptBFGC system, permease protein LptF [Meinhardsimonia xiamenensis]
MTLNGRQADAARVDRLIDMYLFQRLKFRKMLGHTASVFAFTGVIVTTTQVLNQLFRLIDASAQLTVVLKMYLFLVPTITVSVLPLAYLIAAMHVFDQMDEDRESVIILGAGAHPVFLLVPAGLLAAMLSLVVLCLSLFVEPLANRANRALIDGLTFDVVKVIAGDGSLKEVQKGLFIRGGGYDDERLIDGLFVLDRRNPGEEVVYVARKAEIVEPEQGQRFLRLLDGEIQIRDRRGNLIHRARFSEYVSEAGAIVTDRSRASVGPRQTPTGELARMVATGDYGGFSPTAVRKELVRRYTDWLYPLAFFGICALLVSRSRFSREGLRWRLPLAVLAGFALKAAGLTILGSAGAGGLAAGFSYGLPAGAAALLVAAAMLSATRPRRPGRRARRRLQAAMASGLG